MLEENWTDDVECGGKAACGRKGYGAIKSLVI